MKNTSFKSLIVSGSTFAATALVALATLSSPLSAHADQQENFDVVLSKISNTHWQGTFRADAHAFKAIPVVCTGPLTVKFFPANDTDIPNADPTVSYRHDADFSHNLNPLCQTLGKKFSLVDVGSCQDFPMKYSPEEGKNVPFRTLIPRNGGNSAVVSSPSCSRGVVSRKELPLKRLELSPDRKHLLITIELDADLVNAELTYDLNAVD